MIVTDNRLYDLLVAVLKNPEDKLLTSIFFDALEEGGLINLKWIWQGKCPTCGGKLKCDKPKQDTYIPIKYYYCKKCGEDDVDYTEWKESYVNRVIRMLGYKWCEWEGHLDREYHIRNKFIDCKKCNGNGIISR